MANVMPNPDFFPLRANEYVPAMKYSADVAFNGVTRVNFGAPAAASSTAVVSAQSINAAGTVTPTSPIVLADRYGRNLSMVASGAATSAFTVRGYDYLSQPLIETFTLNGTTAVAGVKAFKTITQWYFANTSSVTVDVGTGARLGLPFKALRAAWETANGVAASAGTLTAGVLTDPQTATTGDPRGLYTPTTTLNGSNVITAAFDMLNDVNTSGNGGLHGIRHFTS